MKRLSALILVLFSCSFLAYSGGMKDIDTTFIQVPKQHASVKGFLDFSGSTIQLKGSYEDKDFFTDIRSPFLLKQGVSFNWRFITLSVGFNLLKKPKNYFTIGLNSYGKKFAFELGFKVDRNFKGTQTFDGVTIDIPAESLRHTALTADVYYIFNGDHFSYPAAFGQSRIQRKSSGSAIAAASANFFRTRTNKNGVPFDKNADFAVPDDMYFGGSTWSIGVGYGYNLVVGNMLFHASAIPTLVFLDSSKLVMDKEQIKAGLQFPHFITTGNLAIVYNRNRFFAALRGTIHHCTAGNSKSVQANYLRYNGTLCVGWRF